MALDPQITFRHMPSSPAVETAIRDKVAKLEQLSSQITRCEVVVEEPHRSHRKGDLFHVRIHMFLPGGEIVVVRDPKDAVEHEDPYVALRDAFAAARRQLETHLRRRRYDARHAAE